jgi:hypothetical protein
MWARGAAVAILLGAPAPARAQGAGDAVSRLAWLSGGWVSEADGRWTEEQWSEPRGGLMLGVGRSGKGDRATSFEFMRIAIDADGRIVFWGSPGGRSAVPFHLVEEGVGGATFANPSHDFPKRISYRRDGDRLIATVSGDEPSKTQRWIYRRREPVPAVTPRR